MIGLVVAAHNDLAGSLVHTARLVLGAEVNIIALAIDATDSNSQYDAKLRAAIQESDAGKGVLVLTDMFGGTPSNVGMTMHDPGRVEVLTGVNLPMLIKALQLREGAIGLADLAHAVKAAGQRAIVVASEVLMPSGPAATPATPRSAPEGDGPS